MVESKPANRGERRRLRTRAALVAAAREVFASQGVGATTIQDITDAADVAKGSFYNNFDSKDACLRAVIEETFTGLVRALDVLTEPMSDDPARVVAASLRHTLRTCIEDPIVGWFTLRVGNLIAAGDVSVAVYGRRDMQRGLESGRFDFDDLEIVFTMISGGAEVLIRRCLKGELPAAAEVGFTAHALRTLGIPADEAQAIAAEELPTIDLPRAEGS